MYVVTLFYCEYILLLTTKRLTFTKIIAILKCFDFEIIKIKLLPLGLM